MSSQLLYLISWITLQVSVNAFIVAFTSPSSVLRLALFPVIIICVYQVLPLYLEATGRVLWAALLGALSISFSLQYLDTALLTKWSAKAGGPTAGRKATVARRQNIPRTPWEKLSFGYHVAVSTRHVGTPFQVSGVPHFSSTDPRHVPSKASFLSQKAMLLLTCYLFLDLTTLLSQPDENPVLFSSSKVTLTDPENRTMEQLVTRAASTLGFWISLYCIIQTFMGSMAFLSVALGFSKVESWPPGFDSVTEAYNVRRFWGTFWHKYQQQKMSSPASFLTNNLFHLPRNTPISQYAHLFLTFLISGLIHALTELAQGLPWEDSRSIQFFCTQAFGIVAEDVVQSLYRRIVPAHQGKWRYSSLIKGLGYCYVFAFMVWSTPVWIYPALRANKGGEKDLIVPYSVLGNVYNNVKGL